ncbi:hypothetical protein [Lactobacillus crispatus]|uniref:hypothetical protein n=1 Tax=Lactobacillus crispatus TaxID=47770 RepID=UPI0030FBFAA5
MKLNFDERHNLLMKKLGNKIEAILFFIINSIIAYHLGNLFIKLNLSKWWIFLLPVLFCLAMLPHFALYNLMFGLIYLIIEAFGLMNKNIYR